MSHRYCENPDCRSESIPSIKLDPAVRHPSQLRHGHGFVVAVSPTSAGMVVCSNCNKTLARPKRPRQRRRPTT